MYCELCVYYTEQGKCLLHGKISPEQRVACCDDFIERSFRIVASGGCCGLSGLPFDNSPEKSETDR